MNNFEIKSKVSFLVAIISLINFFIEPANASEKDDYYGNNTIKEVHLTDIGENEINELPIGMVGKIKYTFNISESSGIKKDDTLIIKSPEEIKFCANEHRIVFSENKKIAEISDLEPDSSQFKMIFSEDVDSDIEIETDYIYFFTTESTEAKKMNLDFGNDVTKEFTFLPKTTGIGEFFYDEELPENRMNSWDEATSWVMDATILGDYFYADIKDEELKQKNPSSHKEILKKAVPYYFFGKNGENYSEDLVAKCIDMNHSLSNNEVADPSDLESYITFFGAENIVLNSQSSIMLSEEAGLVIDSQEGTKKPYIFSNDSEQKAYEQRSFLFASHIMCWVDAVKYSVFPDARLENISYSDLVPQSRVTKNEDYKPTDLSSYINDIEKRTELYKQTDYLNKEMIQLNPLTSQLVIDIPEEQRIFTHYIDKENSENLELLDGISEKDFENFETLTVTPKEEFVDQKVKIAFKKMFPDATEVAYTGSGMNDNQYRQILGVSDKYIKKGSITLENNPLTNITVKKIWNDDNNRDNLRSNYIEVQLLANDKPFGEKISLNDANQWTHTWNNLDEKTNGQPIHYTVKEVSEVPGYTSSITDENIGNVTITNIHTPEVIEITGEKIWDDANNQDGLRPDTVVINLLANGSLVDSQSVTENTNWKYTFAQLPKFQDGKEIVYTVTEDSVPNYTTEIKGTTITNHYTPGKTSATVTKDWQDDNNQDGVRPNDIKVQLYANDKPSGEKISLNDANQWTHTWNNLDEKANGQPIHYTVKEVSEVPGYTSSITDENIGNVTITNIHTPEVIEITGEKIWDDANNQDGLRPDTVVINLLANGSLVDSQSVTENTNWKYTFAQLPKFQDGKEIVYTVTEDSVPNYTTEIKGTTITNHYTPGKTSATVTKDWQDDNNQDGVRPNDIKVQLYANDKPSGEKISLNDANQWTHTWNNLDEKANGQPIHYTVKEVSEVPGYTSSITDENIGNVTITNIHTPEVIEIAGEKIWDDANNQDGLRPDTVVINLLANGSLADSQSVTENTNWKYTFAQLPKFQDGKEIVYTVTEDSVPNYTTEIKGTTITNHYTPGKTSATVTKDWQDDNDQDGVRPNDIKVQLYANDKPSGEKVSLNDANQWTHTWNNLDEKANGQPIHYTVKEVSEVPGYTSSITDENIGNVTITNIHTPEVIEIAGEKIWDDANNQDGLRPDTVVINLLANGSLVDSQSVTENTNWKYTFAQLPKFQDGKEIVYTVTEDSVPNYTTEIKGTTITNHYTPGKTSATVTKAWQDNNNQYQLRTKKVKVQLYANEHPLGGEIILDEKNNWNYTWNDLDEKVDGKSVDYSVQEITSIDSYESSINSNDLGNIIITNIQTVDVPNEPGTSGENFPQTGESKNKILIFFGEIMMMLIASYYINYLYKKDKY